MMDNSKLKVKSIVKTLGISKLTNRRRISERFFFPQKENRNFRSFSFSFGFLSPYYL